MIVIEVLQIIMNIFMLGAGLLMIMVSVMGFIFLWDNWKRSREKINKGKHTFN